MIRKVLVTLAILVLIIGGLTYFYFEAGVRRGIEIAATSALGTAVTVSGVTLSPLSGRGGIRDLKIANPEGFNTPYAIELHSVDFEVNLDTLFSDVIEITSIIVDQAQVSYETRLVTDNIRTLINNIPTTAQAETVAVESPAGKRVIIRDFQMTDPQINVYALVGAAPVPLPDLRIQNIGEERDPATIPQATLEIFSALQRSLLSAGVPNLKIITEGVQQQLQDGASRLGDAVEELTDGLRGLLNN